MFCRQMKERYEGEFSKDVHLGHRPSVESVIAKSSGDLPRPHLHEPYTTPHNLCSRESIGERS